MAGRILYAGKHKKHPRMKILITSDNHLGFQETDPIRKDDSFNTFEEILSIAKAESADFVLQGGDLFEENKPSRNTYNKTLQILRRHCLGTRQPEIRAHTPLNWSSEGMAVSLPIICIHGNHDDPSGFNTVSPLDVLESSGLINYFGKCSNIDDIVIRPILLEKDCKVAVYGLGHLKDSLLHRAFLKGAVRYERPPSDDWYSILVVHQNRVLRPTGYLPEDMIDPFFDLVVYGHEHESLKLRHRNFDVIQCGSTVRTSLCDGESHEKYVYILEVVADARIKRVQLATVRPFIMESIKVGGENPEDAAREKLNEMICKANRMECEARGQREGTAVCMLPLLRLRIDIGQNCALNRHRLHEFLNGKVANPADVLRIQRKSEKRTTKMPMLVRRAEISDIYKEMLQNAELGMLAPIKIVDALGDFVQKDAKDAFYTLIKGSIEKILCYIGNEDVVLEDVSGIIKQASMALQRADGEPPTNNDEPVPGAEGTGDEAAHEGAGDDAQAAGIRAAPLTTDDPFSEITANDSLCKSIVGESFPGAAADLQSLHTRSLCGSMTLPTSEDGCISKEFTFLEEKREADETRRIVGELDGDADGTKRRKNSVCEEEDLFTFTKYL